jgi:hypothetical protein
MKTCRQRSKAPRAFTLVEMSLAMVLILGLGLALILMLNTHLEFMNWTRRQSFVAKETPRIANLLGRMLNQADHFFIYESQSDLTNPTATPALAGAAVKLFFNQPEGGLAREQHLIFSQADSLRQLRVLDGQDDSAWTVAAGYAAVGEVPASGLQSASFSLDQGLLKVTLEGPSGEQVHFYGGGR